MVSGQTVASELSSAVSNALSFLSTALLVFALISLFVGAFTIFNTFSITVGQRTRELALLRMVGASRRQVFRSVLGEAVLVGLAASLIGLGLGVLAAVALKALLGAFGVTLPSAPLVFEARTVVVALAVGVGVTVISAIGPARRAVRIAPVAALVATREEQAESLRRRVTIGGLAAIGGIAALVAGLTAPAILLVGLGAVAVFIAAGMLAPIVARPMSGVLGRPLGALLGAPGRLGRENSMRSPRRTAQTAAALMVGIALVSAIAVLGASLSQSARTNLESAVTADDIITGPSSGFSTSVAAAVSRIPGVSTVTNVYKGQFELRGSLSSLDAVDPAGLRRTVHLAITAGSGAPALAAGQLLIDTTTASAKHLSVGSVVPVTFAQTGRRDDADRRDLQGQPADRQLPGRRRLLPLPLPQPAAGRRPDQHATRRGPRREGHQQLPRRVPERRGAVASPVRAIPAGHGQPGARTGLRPPRPRRSSSR